MMTIDQFSASRIVRKIAEQVASPAMLSSEAALPSPRSSVTYGAAGIAYALYRMSRSSMPEMGQLAAIWSTKAIKSCTDTAAFYDSRLSITPETVGHVALYYCATGVYLVHALVSAAAGDVVERTTAIRAFIEAASKPCTETDLTLGRSGVLLGCSILYELCTPSDDPTLRELHALGNSVYESVCNKLNCLSPIREERSVRYLGIAHGWAGMLYACLRWCRSTNRFVPEQIRQRLQQLSQLCISVGDTVRWPVGVSHCDSQCFSGWCHGSAGYVFLWALAHELLDCGTYLELAKRAGLHVWKDVNSTGSLCCGLGGRAYSLLRLYQTTLERKWLWLAEDLCCRALAQVENNDSMLYSLYKGRLGLATLCADMVRPECACMPMFEDCNTSWGYPRVIHREPHLAFST
jgi:eukaryotic-like serine/threonine-protein kinase